MNTCRFDTTSLHASRCKIEVSGKLQNSEIRAWAEKTPRVNMDTFKVILFVLLLFSQPHCLGACVSKHTMEPLYGYRCTDSSNAEVTISKRDRPQCEWNCLRLDMCRYLNHNHDTKQCVLGLGKCEYLTPMIGFTINAFGPPRDSCLHWGSRQEPGRVPVEIPGVSYLARITVDNTLLMGKFDLGHESFWGNNEGTAVGPVYETNRDIEFLTVDPACPLLWMPYTVGDSLPSGVITGGHLSDGSITYASKVIVGGYRGFGYYNARSERAYHEKGGAQTTTSMELLLLL